MLTQTLALNGLSGPASGGRSTQESVQPTAYQDMVKSADELRGVLAIQPRGGCLSLIAEKILAWRERHYVAQASKELLALYRTVSVMHPDWPRRKHYQLVVMHRTGCDPTAANIVLDGAQESFAQWPSSRELTLCDVVHYLSVTEFLALHPGERWMHSSLSHVVASRVPHELCVEREIA